MNRVYNPIVSRQERVLVRRLNTSLTISLCAIGVLWQITSLSIEYFSYEVVTELYLKKSEKIQPPAFSLCLPYVDLIDVQVRTFCNFAKVFIIRTFFRKPFRNWPLNLLPTSMF